MILDWVKGKKSAIVAKDRLTIAIMADRTSTSYPFMDKMKGEIVDVVRKYVDIRTINITKEEQDNLEALSIDIEFNKK
ncbi:MAG: cell division topological specificity factor MinE [Epsilonproteobacteria bacterium]|nr:cell division topological specificity factor MinE [Campylobacterota bacterium]